MPGEFLDSLEESTWLNTDSVKLRTAKFSRGENSALQNFRAAEFSRDENSRGEMTGGKFFRGEITGDEF